MDKLGLGDVRVRLFELIKKSRELKLDYNEYMCLKFLILLNPGKSLTPAATLQCNTWITIAACLEFDDGDGDDDHDNNDDDSVVQFVSSVVQV